MCNRYTKTKNSRLSKQRHMNRKSLKEVMVHLTSLSQTVKGKHFPWTSLAISLLLCQEAQNINYRLDFSCWRDRLPVVIVVQLLCCQEKVVLSGGQKGRAISASKEIWIQVPRKSQKGVRTRRDERKDVQERLVAKKTFERIQYVVSMIIGDLISCRRRKSLCWEMFVGRWY